MYKILREFVDSYLANVTASCISREGNGCHVTGFFFFYMLCLTEICNYLTHVTMLVPVPVAARSKA